MVLKNEEIDQGLLRDKLHIINTAVAILEKKYSKYFNEEDKGILLKINNSMDSINNELNKLDPELTS